MIPVIIVCGKSKSGKDTLANMMAKTYGGVCIAQADLLKRMVQELFGFSNEQLWGTQEQKEALDSRFADIPEYEFEFFVDYKINNWCDTLFDSNTVSLARSRLYQIFNDRIAPKARQEGGLTPRFVLQVLGTDWARHLQPEVWVHNALDVSQRILSGGVSYLPESGISSDITPGPNFVVITDGRFRNEILEVKAVGGLAVNIRRDLPGEAPGVPGHASETELNTIPRHFYDFVINNSSDLKSLDNKGADVVKYLLCHQTKNL